MKTQKSFIAIVLLCCSVCAFAQESWDVSLRSIFDGERRIYYTDIEDAETKILEYYAEKCEVSEDDGEDEYDDEYEEECRSKLPYQMFAELILNDPRAFDYDFERFIAASEDDIETVRPLTIIESPDRKLRLYTWDVDGGTMTNYTGITSIVSGGSVYSHLSCPDGELEMEETESFPDLASGAYAIEQLTDANGETIYAVFTYSSGSNIMRMETIKTYRIRGHFVESAPVFETEYGGLESSVYVYYTPCCRYYMPLECEDGEILLPETRENHDSDQGDLFTGRRVSYKWNGSYFSNNGFEYPLDDDLYPSLKNYQSYVCQVEFAKWIIRVDQMPNGAYRYASWKRPKTTSDAPDMILNRGTQNIIQNTYDCTYKYVFRNNEYSYILSCNFAELSAVLVVKKNSQVLMRIESIEVIE